MQRWAATFGQSCEKRAPARSGLLPTRARLYYRFHISKSVKNISRARTHTVAYQLVSQPKEIRRTDTRGELLRVRNNAMFIARDHIALIARLFV